MLSPLGRSVADQSAHNAVGAFCDQMAAQACCLWSGQPPGGRADQECSRCRVTTVCVSSCVTKAVTLLHVTLTHQSEVPCILLEGSIPTLMVSTSLSAANLGSDTSD